MSNLPSSASEAQMIDLFQNFKMPIMGAGGGFAPIGTINFFDASIAPQGWLACDGTIYNISDYHDLATYYASVHSASNFYGGDGTTTFAVPDLRGEFLRGTGTNGHTNQGDGANVGVHQDGTLHTHTIGGGNQIFSTRYEIAPTNKDYSNSGTGYYDYSPKGGSGGPSSDYETYTSRPTNTSFLICVKATVAGDPNGHVYSTEEQVVGTWVDGKPVYEKTINFGRLPNNAIKSVSLGIENLDSVVSISGVARNTIYYRFLPMIDMDNATWNVSYFIDSGELKIQTKQNYSSYSAYIIVQYTKSS